MQFYSLHICGLQWSTEEVILNTNRSEEKPSKYNFAFHPLLSKNKNPMLQLLNCLESGNFFLATFQCFVSMYIKSLIKSLRINEKKVFTNISKLGLIHKKRLQARKMHWHLNTEDYINSQELTSYFKQPQSKMSKSPNCPIFCQQQTDPTWTERALTGKIF